MLTASLRPLADVLDLTAEAVAALGTLSVGAVGALAAFSRDDREEYPPLVLVEHARS